MSVGTGGAAWACATYPMTKATPRRPGKMPLRNLSTFRIARPILRNLKWSAHHYAILTVALRHPALRHHLVPQRLVGHVAVIGIGSIAEYTVHRLRAIGASAGHRQNHVYELRIFEHQRRK